MEQLPRSFSLCSRPEGRELLYDRPADADAGSAQHTATGAGVKARTCLPSHPEGLSAFLHSFVHSYCDNQDRQERKINKDKHLTNFGESIC